MPTQDEQDYQDYLDYQDYQKHLGQQAPEEPSLKGGSVRGLIDLVRPGFTQGAGHGAVDAASLGNVNTKDNSDDAIGHAAGEGAGMAAVAATGGGVAAAPETALGRIGAQSGVSGLQGLLQKPQGEDTLSARAKGGGMGALLGGGLQTVGEGAGKLGDWLMQKAVGAKKYIPGMGEQLADEGLIGTKGMMKGQVNSALPQREAELQDAVGQMTGKIEPDSVADAIRSKANSYVPESGSSGPMPVPSQNQPFVDAAHSRADEALARGALDPNEALSVSRAVAKPAYSQATGDPLNSFKAQLGQTEGGTLKDALKDAADAQDLPAVRDSLASEAALLNAKRGLNKPESFNSAISKMALKAALGGGVGYELGGKEGAAAGALMSTPAGQSVGGRAAIGASRAAPYAIPALLEALSKAKGGQ